MYRLRVRKLADLEGLHAVEEGAGRVAVVGIVVGHETRFARCVPFLATGHAGMAADADVEVDDQR